MIKKFLLMLTLAGGLLPAADFTWEPLASLYQNGLIDLSFPNSQVGQYEIDNHGRVFLRGIITCTVDPVPANVTVFQLPVGFRPLQITIVSVLFDNNGVNSLQINTDGTVYLRVSFYCNQNIDYLSFEGASFSTK